MRRFWARQPDSELRPLLLDRLYPYLARSPVAQRALAREYFGRDLDRAAEPGFAHRTRWQPTGALQRLFTADVRRAAAETDVVGRLLASLPADFSRWSPLAQDQYLETRTLLTGYLLSSQGDRMLMAHSVEGRFPYLDVDVVELASSLPPSFKLRGLDEKHVLKRAAADLVPPEILRRPKQPYRAPDAHAFVGSDAPDWVGEIVAGPAVTAAAIFDPAAVARLWRKCRAQPANRPFSNADNMALVGILSTGLLHEQLVRGAPERTATIHLQTLIDRVAEPSNGTPVGQPNPESHRQ